MARKLRCAWKQTQNIIAAYVSERSLRAPQCHDKKTERRLQKIESSRAYQKSSIEELFTQRLSVKSQTASCNHQAIWVDIARTI